MHRDRLEPERLDPVTGSGAASCSVGAEALGEMGACAWSGGCARCSHGTEERIRINYIPSLSKLRLVWLLHDCQQFTQYCVRKIPVIVQNVLCNLTAWHLVTVIQNNSLYFVTPSPRYVVPGMNILAG